MVVDRIREFVESGSVYLTVHARAEMRNDDVSGDDLVAALTSLALEVIEDYPNDPRGASLLLLSYIAPEEPLHICAAVREEDVVIITVYRPDPLYWSDDWRSRK